MATILFLGIGIFVSYWTYKILKKFVTNNILLSLALWVFPLLTVYLVWVYVNDWGGFFYLMSAFTAALTNIFLHFLLVYRYFKQRFAN
ncbi:hypothetical protein ACWN8V_10300 [Vagococcus elongatus]|uniref:Uncharacterized protein n=1 Tax=Vagococcus elongatus TaxID=180344 RepID=A0A430AQ10_9ENTE|nr:hypothetical protein [Vagococcus elongatus]RSU10145.1 hypothetical protein CBF29_10175 [Vagococcus elongatus]